MYTLAIVIAVLMLVMELGYGIYDLIFVSIWHTKATKALFLIWIAFSVYAVVMLIVIAYKINNLETF